METSGPSFTKLFRGTKFVNAIKRGRYLSQVFDAFVFIQKHSDIFSEKIRVKLLFTLATNTNLTSPPK